MSSVQAIGVAPPKERSGTLKKVLTRIVAVIFIIAVGIIGGISVVLLLVQSGLIFHPRRYEDAERTIRESGAQKIEYKTSQGNQVAFYIPAKNRPEAAPEYLWIVFGGNGSGALDWLGFVKDFPDRDAAFLLIEYPGYGFCQGKPSVPAIHKSSEAAFNALAKKYNIPPSRLETHLGVLGHSLGAATGLPFAVDHPVERIVLLSPFTSLRDMAGRMVGPAFKYLLLHNLDNRARLNELLQRPNPPPIFLMHGENDNVVPVVMGRELAAAHQNAITYVEIPGGDHNQIMFTSKPRLWEAMTAALPEGQSQK